MTDRKLSVRVPRIVLAVFAAAILMSGFFAPNAQAAVSNIVISAPINGDLWRGTQTINWTADGVDGDMVQIYYSPTGNFIGDGHLIAETSYNASTQSWNTVGLPDGISYKVLVAASGAPFETGTSVGAFTVDNTKPSTTFSLSGGTPGLAGWYTAPPTVNLTCTDSTSDCLSTEYRINGGSWTPGGSFVAPEGENTVEWRSTDNAGNIEDVKGPEIVKVDTQAPSITGHTIDGGSVTVFFNPNGGVNTVDAELTADELVDWVTVRVQKVGDSSTNRNFHPSVDGTTTTIAWNGSLLADSWSVAPDGEYEITYTIRDIAGNETSNLGGIPLGEPYIGIDIHAPSIDFITLPVVNKVYRPDPAEIVPLEYEVSDSVPGTELTCSYSINSGTVIELVSCPDGTPVVTEIDKDDLDDGRNSVVFTVADAAGNSTSSSAVLFVYDDDQELTIGLPVGPVPAYDFATIQEALAQVIDNDTILVSNGDYTLGTSTLGITRDITLRGESETGVTINGSGIDGYGIEVTVNGVTLENFTLLGPAAGLASGNYGVKASHISNFTMRDVTVKGSLTSEIDLNTVTTGLLERVTADGQNTGGVGIALSHSNTITLRDITTLENTWGGVGLFDTTEGATTGVVFDGTNSYGESNKVYIDAEYGTAGATNVTSPEFTHSIRNDTFRPSGNVFTFFQQSEADAISFAIALATPLDSYIQTLDDVDQSVLENNFIVGNGMSIQTAINHAIPDAFVGVHAGTYMEQVTINKVLTLTGAGDTTIIQSPDTLVSTFSDSASNLMKPVVTVIGADAAISQIKIDGLGKGNANNRFVGLGLYNAGGNVNHMTVTGVRNNPLSGVQHGVGIYAYNADSSARSLTVSSNIVTDYQKNAMTFVGSGLTVDIDGNTTTGAGAQTSIAQNGIQLGTGATGTIQNNIVSGNLCNHTSCGSNWYTQTQSSGIMLVGAVGPVTISGNQISTSDMGIYDQHVSGAVSIQNNTLSGDRYFGILLASGDVLIDDGSITGSNVGIMNPSDRVASLLDPVVRSVQLSGNTVGLQNDASYSVDAKENWWDAVSGPHQASTNSVGTGDDVSANVIYSRWCTNAGCTTFGSNATLDELVLAFSPNPATIPAASVLTITAVDVEGNLLVNDTRQIELNGGGTTRFDDVSGPALVNLLGGQYEIDVTDTVAGTANIIAKVLGVPYGNGQVTFVGATPTGITVDSVENLTSIAQINYTYLGGWHYRFRITVNNVSEDKMFVKFANWHSTSEGTVAVNGNTKLFINESGSTASIAGLTESDIEDGLTPFVSYGLGEAFSDQDPAANLVGDLSGNAGRQVEFDVFTRLPLSTEPGAYSTTFGICANATGNPADCI